VTLTRLTDSRPLPHPVANANARVIDSSTGRASPKRLSRSVQIALAIRFSSRLSIRGFLARTPFGPGDFVTGPNGVRVNQGTSQ
jgi:hypothetical protein